MITEAQLQEMEARVNAATDGEWRVVERGGGACGYDISPTWSGLRGQFERVEDARFVAHARQDVSSLIAEVREMQELLASISYILQDLSQPPSVRMRHVLTIIGEREGREGEYYAV